MASWYGEATRKGSALCGKRTGRMNLLIVRWLWRNLRPLDIVNDEGLQDLLRFFEPGYNLPSRTFVAAQLKMRYAAAHNRLKEVLRVEGEAGLSLTSDIWTSRATEAYNTITCHLIDSEWNMKVYGLGTTAFPGHHTGVWIAELLEKTTGDLGIPVSQVCAHVHDQAANAELAGRILLDSSNWASEVCVCHRLQNCLQSAVAGVPALEVLLAKCRRVVGHFKLSALATDQLMKNQADLKMKALKPVQDVATRWNSAYYMLERLYYLICILRQMKTPSIWCCPSRSDISSRMFSRYC